MSAVRDALRRWRRRLKAALPYVRRREHRLLQQRHDALIAAFDGSATPATSAALHALRPLRVPERGEVCLFVSFADRPQLKRHVVAHLEQLLAEGVQVLLILNTELPPAQLSLDAALLDRLHGAWVRENRGYDFAAWAHALAECGGVGTDWSRLYLINDSIVGPLDRAAYARLLERVRASDADLIGLTEALAPRRHLQSYWLVLQRAALRSAALQRLFARVLNWPDKSQVIEVYEARLTALAEADGLRCVALFPNLGGDPLASDDTSLRWAELVDAGMPFVKGRVIAQRPQDERIRAWLRAAGLDAS